MPANKNPKYEATACAHHPLYVHPPIEAHLRVVDDVNQQLVAVGSGVACTPLLRNASVEAVARKPRLAQKRQRRHKQRQRPCTRVCYVPCRYTCSRSRAFCTPVRLLAVVSTEPSSVSPCSATSGRRPEILYTYGCCATILCNVLPRTGCCVWIAPEAWIVVQPQGTGCPSILTSRLLGRGTARRDRGHTRDHRRIQVGRCSCCSHTPSRSSCK